MVIRTAYHIRQWRLPDGSPCGDLLCRTAMAARCSRACRRCCCLAIEQRRGGWAAGTWRLGQRVLPWGLAQPGLSHGHAAAQPKVCGRVAVRGARAVLFLAGRQIGSWRILAGWLPLVASR